MAQETPSSSTPSTPTPRSTSASDPDPRPYEKVITKDAQTETGVFTVHRIKSRVYYEIPVAELNREFLWVTTLARTTQGAGYTGQAVSNRVVRWERRDNRVFLRGISYDVVADPATAISRNVEAIRNASIIMAFQVEANGKDNAPVIDVTRLFTTEVTEFSPRLILRARGFDALRSYIERIKAYPVNIEAEATHTYTAPLDPPSGSAPPLPSTFSSGIRPGSASVVMHFSMVKLPPKPMMPRLSDERVGYFGVRQIDYGSPEQKAARRSFIARWRLEKKDPAAALSEPVKPIVFFVDPATPSELVPYVKRGVEAWQPAFEQAGFKNGIVCKEAPKDDPDWSAEDARHSVIRWQPSTIENAMGPHISDPRTGEILDADIQIYHNVINLVKHWYFVQVGPLNPQARKLPLPAGLMGQLIQHVVTHEVGHSLGLPHNMKASSLYPIEKVRDREWVKKNGHTPTIMDYSRFNYVAQPEDGLDPDDLIPKIGPYDKFAIEWGYKPVPGAKSPEAEKATLNEWIVKAQDSTPWMRFTTAKSNGADPGENTEAVGDSDAIAATRLGLKNLERVMEMLVPAVEEMGKPYDDLEEVYGRVLGQWSREMGHVGALIGGMWSQQKHYGQNGVVFTPVDAARQAQAVQFLSEHALQTPKLFIRTNILRRIEASGILDRIRNAQRSVLNNVLDSRRIQRLTEQEALDGSTAYKPADLMAGLRNGVFTEFAGTSVKTDAFRRNLQRMYIELLSERLNGATPAAGDQRPLFRGELRTIQGEVSRAMAKTADSMTRLHLEDLRDQIAKALDPKFLVPTPATAVRSPFSRGEDEPGCWPDLVIRP